jgi:DNA-binding transcriptional MerR regulator
MLANLNPDVDVKVKPSREDPRMRIGELARRTGTTERALRYYEEQGLLRPARLPSGYREYDAGDLDTVRHVRTLLAAGLTTEVIAEVLPCMVEGDGGRLLATCPELVDELRGERDRITAVVEQLLAARTLLDGILAAPVPGEVAAAACPPGERAGAATASVPA